MDQILDDSRFSLGSSPPEDDLPLSELSLPTLTLRYVEWYGTSSSWSSTDGKESELELPLALLAGLRLGGVWTMLCKNEGRSGAGAWRDADTFKAPKEMGVTPPLLVASLRLEIGDVDDDVE